MPATESGTPTGLSSSGGDGASDIALVAQGSAVATAADTAGSIGPDSGHTGNGATSTESQEAIYTVAITLAGDVAAAAATETATSTAAAAAKGKSEEASAPGGGVSAGSGANIGSILPLLLPGASYEVFITTETPESGGVYGAVLGNHDSASKTTRGSAGGSGGAVGAAVGGGGDVSMESAKAASIVVTTHATAPVR